MTKTPVFYPPPHWIAAVAARLRNDGVARQLRILRCDGYILHHKLIQDLQKYYDDPKLLSMLAQIITNPIETPNGYQNPIRGIALRGPLSQFFSGIYLKPLDDAFLQMNVTYLRYQDDILILCQSQRQMNRCKRRLMEVLNERHLRLSRKKTRMGHICHGFHFLVATRCYKRGLSSPVMEEDHLYH